MTDIENRLKSKLTRQAENHPQYIPFWQSFLRDMNANSISARAAGIALFTIISLFPIVAIMIWVVTFYNLEGKVGDLFSDVKTFVPAEFTQLVTGEIQYREAHQMSGHWYALAMHLVILLLSGGSAARQLLKAFQAIGAAQSHRWILNVFGRSLLMIMTLIMFSLVLSAMGGIIFVAFTYVVDAFRLTGLTLPLQWVFMTSLLSVTLNVVYRWTLSGTQHVKLSGWPGAFSAAALISLMTLFLAAYNHFDPSNSARYGTYGAIRNVLLWLYGCAFAVLVGAQINATRNGVQTPKPAAPDV